MQNSFTKHKFLYSKLTCFYPEQRSSSKLKMSKEAPGRYIGFLFICFVLKNRCCDYHLRADDTESSKLRLR